MYSIFSRATTMAILIAPFAAAAGVPMDPETQIIDKKKNRDGAVVTLERWRKKYDTYMASVEYKGRRPVRFEVEQNNDNIGSPFFSVSLLDLNKDGFWDIEKSGACGNKVCEKTIYIFNKNKRSFSKFFEGAYNKIFVFDGYLIEEGSSGCCARESRAYRMKSFTQPILSQSPDFVVSNTLAINSESALPSDSETIRCSFTDSKSIVIRPPSEKWLRFCQNYGPNFELEEPQKKF